MKSPVMGGRVSRHMIDVGFVDRVMGGAGIHETFKGRVIKGEGLQGSLLAQSLSPGNLESFSGCLIRLRVSVMGIDSPFGWRCGSSSGIVLLELLDGHITQNFVSRKVDGARRPSGVGSPSRRRIDRFPRGKGGDSRRPIEVGRMNLVEFISWHVNSTIDGT